MLKGIALKVGATFAFMLMSTLIKLASARFPVGEVVLFRSAFAMVTLLGWLKLRGEFPRALATRRPLGHVGRSLAGTGGMYSNFASLSLLPLADATAFTFAAPLMVVPLAALALGEAVRPYRWGAVGVGFVGVVIMLSDHLGGESAARALGSTIALGGAGFTALAMIQTRRLAKSEATGAIVFYFTCVTTAVAALSLAAAALWPADAPGAAFAASQRFEMPGAAEAAALVAIGGLGGAGQILMTHAYRYADASVIAAFDYVAMIWAASLGWMVFSETPTPRVLVGAAVVAAAGVYVVWRVRRLHRAPVVGLTAG